MKCPTVHRRQHPSEDTGSINKNDSDMERITWLCDQIFGRDRRWNTRAWKRTIKKTTDGRYWRPIARWSVTNQITWRNQVVLWAMLVKSLVNGVELPGTDRIQFIHLFFFQISLLFACVCVCVCVWERNNEDNIKHQICSRDLDTRRGGEGLNEDTQSNT